MTRFSPSVLVQPVDPRTPSRERERCVVEGCGGRIDYVTDGIGRLVASCFQCEQRRERARLLGRIVPPLPPPVPPRIVVTPPPRSYYKRGELKAAVAAYLTAHPWSTVPEIANALDLDYRSLVANLWSRQHTYLIRRPAQRGTSRARNAYEYAVREQAQRRQSA